MKTMIVSDFAALRSMLVQLPILFVAIEVVLAWAMEDITVAAAALVSMMPFTAMFTLLAYDEAHDWQRFRLTLPLTRRQVVFGRYATIALLGALAVVAALLLALVVLAVCSALPTGTVGERLTLAGSSLPMLAGAFAGSLSVILLACAVALPLTFRFGLTKATRIAPTVFVLALVLALFVMGSGLDNATLPQFPLDFMSWANQDQNFLFLLLGAIVAANVVYWASAFLAAKLYERRAL